MKRLLSLLSALMLWAVPAISQTGNTDSLGFSPYVMWQSWLVFSHGQSVYQEDGGRYKVLRPELGILIRRGRVGGKYYWGNRLSGNVTMAFDQVGRDPALATNGGTPDRQLPITLLEATMSWQLAEGLQAPVLTTGFFRPQIGRESITTAWAVNSFEKAMSQTYLRQHLVANSHGRAPGLNLGGLWQARSSISLKYDFGLFTGLPDGIGATMTPPLWTSRLAWQFGDPEHQAYSISYKVNHFGRRKGITLAAAGAWQRSIPLQRQSWSYGLDLLANHGPLSLDGEWHWLYRQNQSVQRAFAQTGHLRTGWTWPLGRHFLEVAAMVMHLRGAKARSLASELNLPAGRETALDLGLNWYLSEHRWKLSLHYTRRFAPEEDLPMGFTGNDYFYQSGLGPIYRGHYAGLGLTAIIGG